MYNKLQVLLWLRPYVNIDYDTLTANLDYHPRPDTIFAVNDLLISQNVKSKIFNLNKEQLFKIEMPFIIDIDNEVYFSNVGKNKNFIGRSINGIKLNQKINALEEKKYLVCLFEPSDLGFKPNLNAFIIPGFIFTIFTLVVSLIFFSESLVDISMLVFTLLGIVISILLQMKEYNFETSFGRSVCKVDGKDHCKQLLSSKFSTLFGIFKLSSLSLFFLVFQFINYSFLPSFPNPNNIYYWVWIASFLIIPYSLIIQIKEKQYCKLCLLIICIILINGILSIVKLPEAATNLYLSFYLVSVVFSLFLSSIIGFLIRYLSFFNHSIHSNKKILRNPIYLKAILESEPPISGITLDSDITLGNLNGNIELMLIINFNCNACKGAMDWVQNQISNNKNIKAIIRFNLDGQAESFAYIPHHILKLACTNKEMAKNALTTWFNNRDPDSNQKIKPINELFPLTDYDEKSYNASVQQLKQWLGNVNTEISPTIFFNNYQLPLFVSLRDLQVYLQYS